MRGRLMRPIRDYGNSLVLLAILIVVVVFINATSFTNQATGETTWWQSFSTNLIGSVVTIFLFEIFIERRRRLTEKEKFQKTEKKRLIVEMCSRHNAVVINAVHQMRANGWLQDGSLQNANLRNANLCGADLSQADLRGVDFYDAQLKDVNIYNAIFDEITMLPDGNYWSKNIKLKRYLVSGTLPMDTRKNAFEVIRDGVLYIQRGDHDTGAYLLRTLLRYYDLLPQQQATALMWLAETSSNFQYKIEAHQQALEIDPYNPNIAGRLLQLMMKADIAQQQEFTQSRNEASNSRHQSQQPQANQDDHRSVSLMESASDYSYEQFDDSLLNIGNQQTTQASPIIDESMDDTEPMDYGHEQFENPSPNPKHRQQFSRDRTKYNPTGRPNLNSSGRSKYNSSDRPNHSSSGKQNHNSSGKQNHNSSGRQKHNSDDDSLPMPPSIPK